MQIFRAEGLSCSVGPGILIEQFKSGASLIALAQVSLFIIAVIANFFSFRLDKFRDAMHSLSSAPGYLVAAGLYIYLAWLVFSYIQLTTGHALPETLSVWILAFIMEDLCFYFFHRTSHGLGLLWASHAVHHSSVYFNLTVAFRQSWFPFLIIIFYLPLAFAGIPVHIFLTIQALSLLYQACMHTEKLKFPNFLTFVLNSPQAHRVHHSSEERFLNRNFAGVLIVWDRLFKTYTKLEGNTNYGIYKEPVVGNLFDLQFREILRFFSLGSVQIAKLSLPVWVHIGITIVLVVGSVLFLGYTILHPYWYLGL